MKMLALDLGKFNSMCCFFDTATRKYRFLLAATNPDYLSTVFRSEKMDLVVMEAMKELKPVHMPSPEHREFRALVKYRKSLDQRINKLKNAIRAWFVNHGISIDAGDKAWHTGRERINSFRKPLAQCKPNELWKGELDIELTLLDSLTEQLDLVIKKLEAIGKNDSG